VGSVQRVVRAHPHGGSYSMKTVHPHSETTSTLKRVSFH